MMTLLSGRKVEPIHVDDHTRGRLRAAQAARDQAVGAAQRAAGAAERARGAVDAAQGVLARYDRIDGAVAAHLAAGLRDDAGVRALPADLVAARSEQDRFRRELHDATAAAGLLTAEALQAQQAADRARAELAAAIDSVMQEEAVHVMHQLREHERRAVELRLLLSSFLDGRTASDGRLDDHELAMLGHDVVHGPMLDLGRKLRIQIAGRPWSEFRERLMTDPSAAAPT